MKNDKSFKTFRELAILIMFILFFWGVVSILDDYDKCVTDNLEEYCGTKDLIYISHKYPNNQRSYLEIGCLNETEAKVEIYIASREKRVKGC